MRKGEAGVPVAAHRGPLSSLRLGEGRPSGEQQPGSGENRGSEREPAGAAGRCGGGDQTPDPRAPLTTPENRTELASQ